MRAIARVVRRLARATGFASALTDPQLTDTFRNLYAFETSATEREFKQLMYYFELMQLVRDAPGDIAEFGVSGGVSLVALARISEVYDRGLDHKERRRLYGFDSFEGLPELAVQDRSNLVTSPHMRKGGFRDPQGYGKLTEFVANKDYVQLVKGWFDQTIPPFLEQNPHLSFALLHIDCDLYESTRTVINACWPRVVPGGIVVFDELFHSDFPGETLAYREFEAAHRGQFSLRRSTVKPDKKYVVKL